MRERARLDRRLEAPRVKALPAGLSPRLEVATGHTAAQIVRSAEEDKIDLIILGRQGPGVPDRPLPGSASREVLAPTGCAAMVVR